MKKLKDITLEMSLKPFKKTDYDTIKHVCRSVFEQWSPLIKNADTISVMLWTADGSELLDYRGNIDDSFEWAYWIGCANPEFVKHPKGHCDDGLLSFEKHYTYIKEPPIMTYKILKTIVSSFKSIGSEFFPDKTIKVGTTIDPGPEFAVSDLKYNRHNEICTGGDLGKNSFICAYTRLNGDTVSYAGFPDGIPDGTPFGTFFGRQAQTFMSDMGFDFLWLSNGLGFGRDPWSDTGALFDGTNFNTTALENIRNDVFDFWRLFRAECPDYQIRVRGTNNSLAMDFVTDGVPLLDIYDNVNNMLPPPNSPWAALTHDYGFELMGYMSRIAYLPCSDYMFRFYIHDPWWANTPWYDRYFCQPHDIYFPLSVSRIDENGNIGTPTHLSFLTIDNSYGDMPDSCVYEPLPHLMQGFKELPNDIAPIVWVYPARECTSGKNAEYSINMYHGDRFITAAINAGLPLSQVTTSDAFANHDKLIYDASIIVSPVPPAESEFESVITEYCKNGGKIIFYGNINVCGKKFNEIFSGTETPMIYKNSVYIPVDGTNTQLQADKYIHKALSFMGLEICFEKHNTVHTPTLSVHRYNNGYFLTAYSPSVTVETKLKTPFGAPVFNGTDTLLSNGYSTYRFAKAEHKECRVFVEQNDGVVVCRDDPPISINNRRYIEVFGLENATVRFFAEDYCKNNITAMLNYNDTYDDGTKLHPEYRHIGNAAYCEFENVTGHLLIAMPRKSD